MWITVGTRRFEVTLAQTDAAQRFQGLLPLTLNMAELNGNEKHGELKVTLPTNESHPGTIYAGDLMLWGSRTVVVFYKTFRSPYTYTRLGSVNDPEGLATALGDGDAKVAFSGE